MIFAIAIFCIFNFLFGFALGFIVRGELKRYRIEIEEKTIYCHGFEDGMYYALGEVNTEFFRKEMAENSFYEYRAIKKGPEKH